MPLPIVLPESITAYPAAGYTTGNIAARQHINRRFNNDGIFSPFDYGAVGDLVADDSDAIQDAIDAAYAEGGGWVGPLGTHKCLSPLVTKQYVSIFGRNYGLTGASRLHFPTDLGAGVTALSPDTVTPPGTLAAGTFRDFWVTGPGTFSIGTQPCDMDGIKTNAHGDYYNVAAFDFRTGFNMDGDHQKLYSCRAERNYYGVEFPADSATGGNQSFFGCIFVGNSFASVALSSNVGYAFQTMWEGCHFGFGPYGLYRFGTGTSAGFVGSVFNTCAWEYCGNAAFLDESTGTGGGADSFTDSEILAAVYTSSNDTTNHRIASRSFDAAWVARNMRNVRITGSHLPFSVPAGGTSIYKVSGITDNVVDHRPGRTWNGAIPETAGAYVTTPSLNFANGMTVDRGGHRAHARTAIGDINIGDLVGYSSSPGWVTRMTASTAFAGTAINGAVDAGVVLVAPPGSEVDVLCEAIGASGAAIRPQAGTEHHGTTAGSGPIIGYATTPGGGSGGVLTRIATRSP